MDENLNDRPKRKKENAKRDLVQQRIDRHQDTLEHLTSLATRAIVVGKRTYEQWLREYQNAPEAYRNPDSRKTMTMYFVLLGTGSVVVINFLLIKSPVEYILKQTGATEIWQILGAFALPILLLIFELSTGAQLQEARRIEDEDTEKVLEALGWFLICFTPLMIFGTYMAGDALNQGFQWVLMIALMILAGGTDAFIIYGYELIDMARGFVACRISLKRLKSQVERQEEKFSQAKKEVITSFTQLGRRYERHNQAYPQNPILPLAFAHTTAWFVNYARGEEAITGIPPRPPEVDYEFFQNLKWDEESPRLRRRRPPNDDFDNGATTQNPNSSNPNGNGGQSFAAPEPEDVDDVEAERDFYREQLRRSAQNSEREVRP